MFVSQINPQFLFNDRMWVVSILNQETEQKEIYHATVLVEGIFLQRLWVAHYDIEAKRYKKQVYSDTPLAIVSHITTHVSNKPCTGLRYHDAESYYASLPECRRLSNRLQQEIEQLAHPKPKDKTSTLRIYAMQSNPLIGWCLGWLLESGILSRTAQYA